MKLSGFLNKPRWQAKEPAVRRAGVAEDDDADLLANLSGIARADPDPGVRSAALKRLADAALTQRIAQEDPDTGVRAEARKLWFDLLAGTHARSPAPHECERLLRAQEDVALIEHVARNAADPGLRAAALVRVTRVTLLAERVTVDPTPDLRLAALERIDDEALLDRLAERTRKIDKRVSRRARERADALRIARGDGAVAETFARTLCERMERLVREPQSAAAKAEIDSQWMTIEARASGALRARYEAARTLLAAANEVPPPRPAAVSDASANVDTPRDDAVAAESVSASDEPKAPALSAPSAVPELSSLSESALPDSSVSEESSTPPPDRSADPLLAQARFAASVSAATADKQQAQDQRQAAMLRAENAVAAFERAVEDGVAARAHVAHAELAALRKESAGALTRALQRRVTEAERRYAELSQWQHWSDNQRRRQLCESIEELSGSGLHPDAIATRVREAQAEWSRLDVAEGHAAHGQPVHGWARRFHAACRRALEPAKSYFKKRQELRKTHAQSVSASLEQANAIPADSSDWPLIARTRHAIVDALRGLDRIDPRERKTLAKNLKAALVALDARLSAHQAEIEGAKSALIAEAQALAADESNRGAAAAGRALQQRWRDIGNGRRDRDQAQWKAFRTALDVVFGKLDAERSQRVAREADSRVRAEVLCAELEQVANSDARPQRSAVSRIETEWDSLRVRDEPLQRRFRAAQGALREAGTRHERATRRGPYETWLTRYAMCRTAEGSAETADDLRAAWDAAPRAEIAASALATRFENALQARADGATASVEPDTDALREVLIRLEILAGLDSPREDHDRRRELQVERLSARMRGAAATTPHQELAELLTHWTELDPAPSELDARLRRDLAAAVETLP